MKTSENNSNSSKATTPTPLVGDNQKENFFTGAAKSSDPFFGPSTVQPKLNIGDPDDQYEREADYVADAVMNSPTTQIQRQKLEEEEEDELQMKERKPEIQRKCEECKKEETVHRKTNPSGQIQNPNTQNLSSKLKSSSGRGSRLPENTQLEMETKMGANFDGVSIHTGSDAARMNQQLGARAFAYGSDIYFNRGEYNPTSSKGKHLLAHELTHVVQQDGASLHKGAQPVESRTEGRKVQGGFFGDLWEGVKDVGEAVVGAVGSAWDKATEFVGGAAEWMWEGIKSLSSTVVDWLSTAGEHVWAAIKWFGNKAWEGIKWLGELLWEKLALIGTNLWSFLSNIPVRLWRVIVHGWEGIKGIVSWAWSGLKSAAGHIWEGLTSVFEWLGKGVSGALEWLLNGVVAGYEWAVDFIQDPSLSKLYAALTGALSWAWDGIKGFARWGWEGIKGAAIWVWRGFKGFGSWLWEGIVSGAKWAGEMLVYVLDLIGFTEALQIVWGLIFRMRKLTPAERKASEEVHPPGMIPYDLIRVDENSVISMIGGAAVTTFHVLHYPKGGIPLDVVVHELTHVAQYENVGAVYMPQAVHAQAKYGRTGGVGSGSAYDYERTGSLASQRAAGKKYKDLNRESQAELVQDFYNCKISNSGTYKTACADFIPFIDDMQRGEF